MCGTSCRDHYSVTVMVRYTLDLLTPLWHLVGSRSPPFSGSKHEIWSFGAFVGVSIFQQTFGLYPKVEIWDSRVDMTIFANIWRKRPKYKEIRRFRIRHFWMESLTSAFQGSAKIDTTRWVIFCVVFCTPYTGAHQSHGIKYLTCLHTMIWYESIVLSVRTHRLSWEIPLVTFVCNLFTMVVFG